jgi:predicted NBD/HSP70 family sugar kinase
MVSARKATQQSTKQHNRDLVFNTILANELISRAEIARSTQLTRTTVSEVVAGLIGEGLVEEAGFSSSVGGKPSIQLSLVADSRYRIGLNLARDRFTGAVVNLRGDLKDTVEIPVQWNDRGQALQLVFQIVDQLLKKGWKPIVGIGVGAPGLINTREGQVVRAVNLDWQDFPLAHLLQERYQLPVAVMNDSQATAVGEFVYGHHQAGSNLIVITVNNGIGAGLLINGQLFQGDNGYAGEIGHVSIPGNEQVCRCGKRGCLETIASTQAIVQRVQAAAGSTETLSLEQVLRRFNDGDATIRQFVEEAGHALGATIGSLSGALNINTVVLTGDMIHFGQVWLDATRQAFQQSVLSQFGQETQIKPGTLDFRACILGASAHLFLENYSLLYLQPEK